MIIRIRGEKKLAAMNLKQIVGSHLHMSHFNQYCFIFEDESMCVWNKMKSYRQSPVVEKDKMI